jgi:transcriptional regulator with XRE-family HTH domain
MAQPPVWAQALERTMVAKGYRSQAALVRAARKKGVRLRPNTLSAVLSGTEGSPRMETLVLLARALEVPLWTFYFSAEEHGIVAQALAQHREQQVQERSDAAIREAVLTQLSGLVDTVVQQVRAAADAPIPLKPRKRAVP